MLKEFKTFAMRGNVIDLAVGVVIGGAFGAIVKSLVDDVIMPPIGLLIGNVINQRPELFGAAVPAVGVMDMLRFHLFTAGRFWTDDYGSAEDPREFEALYAYSPYHNIEPGKCYPPVLATTVPVSPLCRAASTGSAWRWKATSRSPWRLWFSGSATFMAFTWLLLTRTS